MHPCLGVGLSSGLCRLSEDYHRSTHMRDHARRATIRLIIWFEHLDSVMPCARLAASLVGGAVRVVLFEGRSIHGETPRLFSAALESLVPDAAVSPGRPPPP